MGSSPTTGTSHGRGRSISRHLNVLGCTVRISGTAVAFGFADATAEINADFTDSRLIATDHLFEQNSYKPFQLTFTNSAVTSLALVSASFPPGSLTGSLAGEVITLNWEGGVFDGPETFQAMFDVTLPPPPRLRIQLTTTNTLLISWPAPSPGFSLQENRHLGSTNWVDLITTPKVTDGKDQVTVARAPRARFYRLKYQ